MIEYGLSTCIGETITDLPYPVFYDPHYSIRVKKPPVTLITGSPGSGKTFLGVTLAAHASLLGKIGFILDPKGDFIALKNLERQGFVNKIKLWSIASKQGEVEEENAGILDPTLFYSNYKDNSSLTIDVIKTLCGGEITHSQVTTLTPIVNDITMSSQPSFGKVVNKLISNKDNEISALGYTLETILNTSLAKLLVANKRIQRKTLTIGNEIVVVNLMGLTLPPDTKAAKDYNSKEKVSIIILSLISTIILDMMRNLPPEIYKILMADEAWAIMATQIGSNMVKETARLGRSRNLAMILMTQSSKHLGDAIDSDLNTMISTRFAFRNEDEVDNLSTIRLMRLPENEGWENNIKELETGQCLLQNTSHETGFIHILSEDDWIEYLNTTPIKSDS